MSTAMTTPPRIDHPDWFWTIGDDSSRAWSTRALTYVSDWDRQRQSNVATETDVVFALGIAGYDYLAPGHDYKARLKRCVDADAEAQRERYITPGAGQAMTYKEKHEQAMAVEGLGEEAANALTPEQASQEFPVLAAGVGIDAPTLWGCSQIVIQMAEQWSTVAGAIERIRLQSKKSISDASDAAAAQAAYEAITWPSP